LKLELLIAKKILKKNNVGSSKDRHNYSKPIVNLAIIGITLGVAVMILSSSIAIGFQSEIKKKILGFGAPFQVSEQFENNSFESNRMLVTADWVIDLKSDPLIKHVQVFAHKPGIIQSKSITDSTQNGKEIRDLSGIIFKGIGNDYDKEFIEKAIMEGQFPTFEIHKIHINDSILISKHTATQLKLKLNDKVSCFFVSNNGPQQRQLIVAGIYETGLEDFDKQFAFVDINLLRQINQWGISSFLQLNETCEFGYPIIEAKAFGGLGNYRFQWDKYGYQELNKIPLCPLRDTTIQVIISEVDSYGHSEIPELITIPDTAWLNIKVEGSENCICDEKNEQLVVEYLNDSVSIYTFKSSKITTTLTTSGGSNYAYCGGYEIILKDLKDLDEANKSIRLYTGPELNIQSITERYEEIFKWLDMLDMNVYIILALMIIVAIINMIATLLVIILERTRMIGILKAIGATDWSIRKIFIYQGSYIILKGLIFGNIFAFLIIILQNQFHIITLPQANYYVSIVPMYFPIKQIVLINLLSFIIASFALVLPTAIITKIRPVKAIQFE
jgi:lipoprotein-releasing system permease protein